MVGCVVDGLVDAVVDGLVNGLVDVLVVWLMVWLMAWLMKPIKLFTTLRFLTEFRSRVQKFVSISTWLEEKTVNY